jgi:hypothetical protein
MSSFMSRLGGVLDKVKNAGVLDKMKDIIKPPTPPPPGGDGTAAPQPPSNFGNYFRYAFFAVGLIIFGVQLYLYLFQGGAKPDLPEPMQQPVMVAADDVAPPNAFGWNNDPEQVKAAMAGMEVVGEPDEAFLWKAYDKLYARPPPEQDQNPVGSCVGFGTSRAYERSLAVQIVQGDNFEFKHVCEESIYALSRVEIGGGRIRGDGSVGAWAARALTEFGILPRGVYGRFDLMRYDPSRCRDWGRSGLPNELEQEAAKFKAGDCARVVNWSEAKKALASGYGIAVCSNQGFARQRDANGVCRAQGEWAHCMCLDGYKKVDGKEYGHIENSWNNNYHVGPVGWGEPNKAGFWAEASVIDRMLRQGDSWAVAAVKGFPARKLNWFAGNADIRPTIRVDADRPEYALAP